ncbi:hypothetical protein CYY_006899 [Polysphondylium violaceum]|uniref:Cystatin domain-containing protein n=1 Tax=Polysphondylium violaceum TaxID=133409 RepID=A0A8J4V2Q1_9MYCE|nr:hypothetical protein CYY_006899 [Polysphondylium violaceum]
MVIPGGFHDAVPVDAEVEALTLKHKADVEAKLGRTLEVFKPVSYKKQVVAGTNFLVKVEVPTGFIKVKVFRALDQVTSSLSEVDESQE